MSTLTQMPPTINIWPEKKAAAYCRVSTHDSEQLTSLEAQERYYEERIRANPYWTFARILNNKNVSYAPEIKIPLITKRDWHRFHDVDDSIKLNYERICPPVEDPY